MKHYTQFFFITFLIFLFFYQPVLASRAIVKKLKDFDHNTGKLGTYKALVIGIDEYSDPAIPDLQTAVRDARAMAEVLQKSYGFEIRLLLNKQVSRKNLYNSLRKLASESKPEDSVLIYYAGHGDLDRTYNDGWWIPADAKGGDPASYLDNVQIQKAMRSMQARHVLLISDSCYSGSLFGSSRAVPPVIDDKYYLSLYNEKSRWGLTSGNKEPVEDSGTDGHSIFAYQLLKELRNTEKKVFTTQELYTRIAPIIGNNSEQTPLCRPIRNTGDQGGEFVFVRMAGGESISISDAEREPVAMRKDVDSLPGKSTPGGGRVFIDEKAARKKVQKEAVAVRPQQKYESGQIFTEPTTGMQFVYVEGGCYQMGDTFGDGIADEKPEHEVCVDGFFMGKHEVTQSQYRKIAGVNPSKFKKGDNYPVEMVSWNDVQEYIRKLNDRSGKNFRLPTESEWEYAARSGGKKEKYAGSNSIDSVAWYRENSGESAHPVGRKSPNGLGLYDMSGNVWEWCSDFYDSEYYKSSPRNNPQGPSSGSDRVMRGGSWIYWPAWQRAAARDKAGAASRNGVLGFRLVFSGQ